ncbi:MAG: SIMPL domain-containing protein [Polyangiaceae bacterium]
MPSALVRRSFLLAVAALSVFATACSTQQPSPTYISSQAAPTERTITVSGAARLEITPNEACIELTIAARDPAMSRAHARLLEDVEPLVAELSKVDGLVVERGAIRYQPENQADEHGMSHLVGYLATAQINVRTQRFERIPDVVGRASSRGLDQVNVVFYSTDIVAKKSEVRAQALAAANEKARAMAEALGVSLGEVVTITEGDVRASSGVSTFSYLERGNVDAGPDTPAPPGSLPLVSTVGVVYRVKS